MLRNKGEATEGRIVYLWPHTKTAGQYAWMKKTAVIIDADHWPRVRVSLTHNGQEVESYVHKDDIKLRPPSVVRADRRQGDVNNDVVVELGSSRKTSMRAESRYEMELPDGVEQGTLW